MPLHLQAAEPLRQLIALALDGNAAARHDPSVGKSVRYVFVHRGKPMSRHYLFEEPLAIVCRQVGLVDGQGRPTVTAHRFRHTVGTQLAEGGARIQTIMAILGHRSAQMSATYSRVSDPIVKEQYERIIATGGRIAGPAATALLDNQLDDAIERGWSREVERHTAISRRLCELLADLGEPTDPALQPSAAE